MFASDLMQERYKLCGSVAKGVASKWPYEMPAIWVMCRCNEPVASLDSPRINKVQRCGCPARVLLPSSPPLEQPISTVAR